MARSASTFRWDGLKEYRDQLAKLPEDCRGEAAKTIEGVVNGAYVTIARVYGEHQLTGTLRRRLVIAPLKVAGQMTTGLVLRSGSPLAWLFDNGSQARHYTEESGVPHSTGKMWGKTPPTHIFARTVGFGKRKITDQLKAMLLRHGATRVTGP
jgi:hypothetical protein